MSGARARRNRPRMPLVRAQFAPKARTPYFAPFRNQQGMVWGMMLSLDEGETRMAVTTKERVRAVRGRRRRREILLRLVLHEDDLRHIAGAGPDYLEGTSTDPKRQAAAVGLWISDQVALQSRRFLGERIPRYFAERRFEIPPRALAEDVPASKLRLSPGLGQIVSLYAGRLRTRRRPAVVSPSIVLSTNCVQRGAAS